MDELLISAVLETVSHVATSFAGALAALWVWRQGQERKSRPQPAREGEKP